MAGGARIKINYRWIVQALAFVGCIFSFLQMWELSKRLLAGAGNGVLVRMAAYLIVFVICFFLMALTSYLKQQLNGTLKNRIALFDKIVDKFHLAAFLRKSESR